jgi:hypothetical protein
MENKLSNRILIREWKAINGFKEQLMYTKSVHYDVARLIVEIESESPKDKFTIRIEFTEGCISFRATEEPYLENFWDLYKNVNWKQTFFIFEKPSENDFLLESGKLKKITPNTPEGEVVHYAVYTYDVFFEFYSLETPKLTMYR